MTKHRTRKRVFGPYTIPCDPWHRRPWYVRVFFPRTRQDMYDFVDSIRVPRDARAFPHIYTAICLGYFVPHYHSVSTIVIPVDSYAMRVVTHEVAHATFNYLRYRFSHVRRSIPITLAPGLASHWEEQFCLVSGQINRCIVLKMNALTRRYRL